MLTLIEGMALVLLRLMSPGDWFTDWILRALWLIITVPFGVFASVLFYLDLRSRKELLTADVLRAELARV